jgi:hypothetical protein
MKSTGIYVGFGKVEDNDDGTITVTGIASTANPDNEGETVLPSAMEAALPDYMRFGAIREMHQATTAAGTALSAKIDDEGVTHLSCLVVDDDAIKKVKTGVYKGFSIGGKVLGRDPMDKTVITDIKLTEISLVDRPCNPEAVINMWKVDMSEKTAAGSPATEEGAVDALAEIINNGEMSPHDIVQLVKAAQAAQLAKSKKEPDRNATSGAAADESEEDEFAKKDYSDDDRKEMAASGEALPDGSFPIKNRKDLSNAVKAYGRAKDKDAAKKHIKARAKDLGAEDALPDKWDEAEKAASEAAIAAADAKGEPDEAKKAEAAAGLSKSFKDLMHGAAAAILEKANKDGADTSVQNTGVADVKNADTPMLPKPEIGQLADFSWGDKSVQGKITEVNGTMFRVGDDEEVWVNSAKLTYAEFEGNVMKWSKANESTNTIKAASVSDLRKGMWTVSDFARLLQELLYLQQSMQWETDSEKDGSTIAGKVANWGKAGTALLVQYVQEEAAELFSGVADPDNVAEVVLALSAQSSALAKCDAARLSYAGDLTKVNAVLAKSLGVDDLAKVGARHSAKDMEHIQNAHDALCKLGCACSKDNVRKEDGDDGDMAMALQTGDLAKAMTLAKNDTLATVEALVKQQVGGATLKFSTALKKVTDENGELRKSLEALKATPAAPAVQPVTRVVSKEEDNSSHLTKSDDGKQPEVVGSDGKVDPVASAIRKSQAGGGITITNHGPASRGLQ